MVSKLEPTSMENVIVIPLHSDLLRSAATNPSKVAISDHLRDYTYSDLVQRIGNAARSIHDQGYGDCVIGISAATRTAELIGYYACSAAGCTGVSLSGSANDIERLSQDANVRGILELDTEKTPTERPIIKAAGADAVAPECAARNPAVIIYTSGTTANLRKGVLVSHQCIRDCALYMNEAMSVDASIDEIHLSPVDHLYGLGRAHAVLAAGGTLRLPIRNTQPRALIEMIGTANSLGIVPSVLATLVLAARSDLAAAGRGVRWIQTGAMRLDAQYRQALLDCFPNAAVFLHYGLSEVMRATMLDLRMDVHKMHTEGRPRPGISIAIRDDKHHDLPAETEGNIWISGRGLAMGYTQPDAWQERIRDGWYRTGDVGLLDADGYLVFRGRSDDILNVNGLLVHPAEVEKRLSGLVHGAFCIAGIRDPRGIRDTILTLCIEGTDTGITRADITRAVDAAPHERHLVPEQIHYLSALPRTSTGKIKRREVAALVEAPTKR